MLPTALFWTVGSAPLQVWTSPFCRKTRHLCSTRRFLEKNLQVGSFFAFCMLFQGPPGGSSGRTRDLQTRPWFCNNLLACGCAHTEGSVKTVGGSSSCGLLGHLGIFWSLSGLLGASWGVLGPPGVSFVFFARSCRRRGFDARRFHPVLLAGLRAVCGQAAARQRPGCGQTAAKQRPGIGQAAARLRPVCGQAAARLRPGCGQAVATLRPGCGQAAARLPPGSGEAAARLRPDCGQATARQRPGCGQAAVRLRPGCGQAAGQGC